MSMVLGGPNPDEAKVFYDWVLTPEVQELMPEAGSFQIPSNASAKVPDEAPDLGSIKLIDYDFATYGSSDKRKELLARWDAEIGGRAAE
ncbi:MAG: ABC transporter substrate-binding protein [Defluviimonas denitrificans]